MLEIDGREIKCRVPLLSEVPTVEVKAVKSYSIPARTEMVIEGRIEEEAETMTTGMLTGIPKFMRKRQVGVAATLARRRGKIVPVRVLNPSARKRSVAIGDIMAAYQAVEVLEDPARSKGRAVRARDGPSPWAPELEDTQVETSRQAGLDGRPLRAMVVEETTSCQGRPSPDGRPPRAMVVGEMTSCQGRPSPDGRPPRVMVVGETTSCQGRPSPDGRPPRTMVVGEMTSCQGRPSPDGRPPRVMVVGETTSCQGRPSPDGRPPRAMVVGEMTSCQGRPSPDGRPPRVMVVGETTSCQGRPSPGGRPLRAMVVEGRHPVRGDLALAEDHCRQRW